MSKCTIPKIDWKVALRGSNPEPTEVKSENTKEPRKLLVCPFCRSNQVELQSEFDYANKGWANVICLHCLAHGPTAKTLSDMTIEDVENKAVFEWNHRDGYQGYL